MDIMNDQQKIVYLSRFEVKKLLKASGIEKTFLGFDLKDQSEVVIKTFLTEGSEIQQKKIEQESIALKRVSHPSLAQFIESGIEQGQICLAFSYIPGETLETTLKHSKLSLTEALSVGKCLLNGLEELHQNHLLHRNIRPSNVILEYSANHALSGATLIDFGVNHGDFLEDEVRNLPLSTVRSLAPEQTGLLNFELSPASDLYSLGVLLFEALLGEPLFNASDVSEILRQHLTHTPIDLVKEGIIAHRSFNDFLHRLVRKDPNERYQSAHAALKDLIEIENSLQNGNTSTSIALGRYDTRNSLTFPSFVSREKELQILNRTLELTFLGHGELIFIEANSGGGKTRLIKEFSRGCGKFPVKTIHGQGVSQVAPQPLEIFRILIEELIESAPHDPQWINSISKKLGSKIEAICDIFPQLEKIFGRQEKIHLVSEAHGEMRSIPALSSLLDAIGNESQPAVIILDDFQWADHLSMKVLEYWWNEKKSAPEMKSFSLIIASFQTEKVTEESILRKLIPSRHFQLAPFGAESTQQLLESMAGPLQNEVVQHILQLSDGNPFFAISILQGMVESGTLAFKTNGWEMKLEALPSTQSSRKAVAFLSKRLTLLPQETRNLLEVGAILGKRFDLRPLSVLAHQTEEHVCSAIQIARHRHIIWEEIEGTRFAFVHDKLREAILDNIEGSRRKELPFLQGNILKILKTALTLISPITLTLLALVKLPYLTPSKLQRKRGHSIR